MKKHLMFITVILLTTFACWGQERLFSIGVTKNYISKDSTNLSLTLDLNRIPGSTEKAGGYFFVNEVIGKSQWGWYVKPTIDVNIGSGTTTAPNNISVGVPVGVAYDFKKPKVLSLYIEGSPDFVADKTFDNYLLYFTIGSYLKFEYNKSWLLNVTSGLSLSNGKRSYSSKIKGSNGYGRFTIPVFVKLNFWNATFGTGADAKPYKRINITNAFKFSNVYKDNAAITSDKSLFYFSSKLDFYFIPRLAFSMTYNSGNEEPLFKKVKSLSFGLTLARF
jgi:hypothetical protein